MAFIGQSDYEGGRLNSARKVFARNPKPFKVSGGQKGRSSSSPDPAAKDGGIGSAGLGA
jgi:hypothetical protein